MFFDRLYVENESFCNVSIEILLVLQYEKPCPPLKECLITAIKIIFKSELILHYFRILIKICSFSLTVILVFITRRQTSSFWNVFLWVSMFQGWGILTVFYSVEWYARINCPRTLVIFFSLFLIISFYSKLF